MRYYFSVLSENRPTPKILEGGDPGHGRRRISFSQRESSLGKSYSPARSHLMFSVADTKLLNPPSASPASVGGVAIVKLIVVSRILDVV